MPPALKTSVGVVLVPPALKTSPLPPVPPLPWLLFGGGVQVV